MNEWAFFLDFSSEGGNTFLRFFIKEIRGEDGTLIQGLRRNWGGIVIVAHKNPRTGKVFFSLYGHLVDLQVSKGDRVEQGEILGVVAEAVTEDNGMWGEAHLHFGIFVGPWMGRVLPGYWSGPTDSRTRLEWWCNPLIFLENYGDSGKEKTLSP